MPNACAVHAGSPATFTCSRCGSFACEACASPEPGLCMACDHRRGSVLGTDVSAGGLIGDSFRLVARFAPAVAVLAVVDTVAGVCVALVGRALPEHFAFILLLGLADIAVTTIVEASWISLLASAAHGSPLGIGEALQRGASAALPLFACNLILGLGVGLGVVLLIIPGIIIALGWCLAAPAVVIANRGPVEALGDSWSLTDGHRVALLLAFIATGGVALVISAIVGAGVTEVVKHAPAAAVVIKPASSLIGTIASAPALTVPVLAYLRLNRRFTAD